MCGSGRVKPGQFQQGEDASVFLAGGFVEHNYLGRTFLRDHATPEIRRSGALRTDLNLVGGLDNLHCFLQWAIGGLSVPYLRRYLYSFGRLANVKNMLKASLTLWKSGTDWWRKLVQRNN